MRHCVTDEALAQTGHVDDDGWRRHGGTKERKGTNGSPYRRPGRMPGIPRPQPRPAGRQAAQGPGRKAADRTNPEVYQVAGTYRWVKVVSAKQPKASAAAAG